MHDMPYTRHHIALNSVACKKCPPRAPVGSRTSFCHDKFAMISRTLPSERFSVCKDQYIIALVPCCTLWPMQKVSCESRLFCM
jgi:hypothetical protein